MKRPVEPALLVLNNSPSDELALDIANVWRIYREDGFDATMVRNQLLKLEALNREHHPRGIFDP